MTIIRGEFDLQDRVAVVTGALGKLGGIFSEALLHANARVAAIDLANARESLHFGLLQRRFPGRIERFTGNVTDKESMLAACREINASLGTPAVLVNNAGIDQPPGQLAKSHLLEDIPADVCRAILEVNLLGLFVCTQAFLPALKASKRGSVINVGSLYASVSPDARFYDHLATDPPFLKPPMYGASKAGVVNLTKYLAAHLGPAGVRVNTLSPGGVAGGQDERFIKKFCDRVPLGRMAVASDLAGPLVFLASDASAYVTGIELRVDGGFTAW